MRAEPGKPDEGTEIRLRWTEPDLLRSMAFFGVVAQHILGAWARRRDLGYRSMALISICFELVRFAVPMFVFLFGMMLARSAARGFDAAAYWKKRFVSLVIPYALWSAYYVLSRDGWSALNGLPRLLLTGGAEYHLWYVPMILQFVILAPLFVHLFRRIEGCSGPYLGWLCFIMAGFVWLLAVAVCGRCQDQPAASFIWRRQSAMFLSWLVYFAAGAFCGSHYDAFQALARKAFPFCLAGSAAALFVIIRVDLARIAASGTVDFNAVGLQRWYYAPIVLMFFICLQRLAMLLSKSALASGAAGFVGAHSYRAYLCHVAFITGINRRIVARFSFLPVYYLLLMLLTVAASLALAFALDSLFGYAVRRLSGSAHR